MQQIIRHLFKADTLEEVSRERLEELVGEYPSFGIARYLLSSKLRSENADNFTEETQRTNLYFTNPFWLHWLLQEKAEEKGWEPRAAAEDESIGPIEEPHPAEGNAVIAMGEAIEYAGTPPWEEAVVQPAADASQHEIVDQPAHEHMNDTHEHMNGTPVPPAHEQTEHEQMEEAIANEPLTAEPHSPGEAWIETQNAEASPPETQMAEPEMSGSQVEAEPEMAGPQVEASPAETPWAEPAKEPAEETPLVFQSYHTIDYFASQGIKFTAEENPSDRLGKQMKSFTEWLKVMKRIPQKEGDVLPDVVAEHKIQAIAAHSIESREILTETMAEVLAKQGMWEKAAEVYRKLSLLNPDKSSYFAGKIEQIQARSNN